jgi:hypothetical protein
VQIDWATLAAIAVVAAAAAVTVVLLVAFAILGLSASAGQRASDRTGGGASGLPAAAGTALAVLCLLATGLVVCYGLYLIVA